MSISQDPRLPERGEARRHAIRRRPALALVVLALVVAAAVVGVLRATGGDGAVSQRARSVRLVAVTTAREQAVSSSQAETEQAAPPNAKISIAAVGDIVMGSAPNLPPDGGAGFFSKVDDELRGDVVLGNLEGTLSTGGSSKCGAGSSSCFAFRTPPGYAKWLKRAGFTVMNLANNHAYDFGSEGQRQTVAALNRQRLLHTGRPGEIAMQQVGSVRVAILGFAPYSWAQSLLDIAAAKRLVREADVEADLVIVTFHGGAEGSDKVHVTGDEEYFLGEDRGNERRFAHAVVDAGADLVVGHGPHVLRGMEWYRQRLIAYSMGNFAGYGVLSLSGVLSVSGLLQVTLGTDGSFVQGKLVPTQLVGEGLPALDPAERAHGIVRELSRQDFGLRGVRISRTGVLRPPAR